MGEPPAMNRSTLVEVAQGISVDVEPIAKRGDERLDVFFRQLHHKVHVQSRARLTTDRAGQRAANEITHAARFQSLRNDQGDANRIGNQSQRPERRVVSG